MTVEKWLFGRDDRQDDVRRMPGVVMEGVGSDYQAAVCVERLASIRVDIEAREVAARYVHADAMALFENVRCGIKLDREGIHLAGFHQFFLLQRLAKARPDDAIGEIEIKASGPCRARLMHIEELGGKIRIQG